MKKLFGLVIVIVLFLSGKLQSQITVEAFPRNPQTGQYNYFGVRVTLSQTYSENVTVTGYIFDDGSYNTNNPFTLTVTTGNLIAETDDDYYQTSPAENAAVETATISTAYAGATIIFEVNNNILRFANFSDINAVINQLNDDYEDNYAAYDSQIDTSLSVAQLDSIDEVNGFNPRITYRNFEDLFPGFSSKRAEVEDIEADWLYNNLSGTNPSDVDLTYDDAINSICNTDYSFKIGNDLYQITSAGIYINETLQDDGGGSVARVNIINNGLSISKSFQNNYDSFHGP